MAPAHLALELLRHVVRGELAALLGDHELERQVEQQVAHLAPDGVRLALAQRVIQLQHLLDEIGPQRLPGLRPVPGTPTAELAHHRERASKR